MPDPKRPLKVFLCHTHADTLAGTGRDRVRGLPEGTRLTALALPSRTVVLAARTVAGSAREDGVDAWLAEYNLLTSESR